MTVAPGLLRAGPSIRARRPVRAELRGAGNTGLRAGEARKEEPCGLDRGPAVPAWALAPLSGRDLESPLDLHQILKWAATTTTTTTTAAAAAAAAASTANRGRAGRSSWL
jgi:hypothetical protein